MACDDIDDLRERFDRQTRVVQGRPWLCMVSGGSDSTALAYLAAEVARRGSTPVALFHANHHLRGKAADGDAAFVTRLAAHLDCPLYTANLALEEATAGSGNVEALARAARYDAAYDALDKWCAVQGQDSEQGVLLAAHTLDDRVENLFMRTLVGTGPGGFRGMVRQEGRLRRPLLDATRDQLRHLIDIVSDPVIDERDGGRWCEDATNADTDRLRAFVRHELIPLAKTRASALEGVLGRTMDLIADEDDYMEARARALADAHLEWLDDSVPGTAASAGFHLSPTFGEVARPLARRVVHRALAEMAGRDGRIDTRAVEAVLNAYDDGRPVSGYVTNIQGNLAVSANKRGVTVEPMETYRRRRKPDRVSRVHDQAQGDTHE